MSEKLNKKDFIEIDFTGRLTESGDIFDSTIESDLKKSNLNLSAKPYVLSIGSEMIVRGVDEFLEGKEIGKEYEITLEPEKAFGKRNPKLVQMIPTKIFIQQRLNPVPGAMFNMDGRLARIISVSGGRTMTDFNNPLAGKNVTYKIKINKKVDARIDQVKSVLDFFLKRDFPFEVKEKEKKLIITADKQIGEFLKIFSDKFREILDLDLEVEFNEVKSKKNVVEKNSG